MTDTINRRSFIKLGGAFGVVLGLGIESGAAVEEVKQEVETTSGLDAIRAADSNVIGLWGTAWNDEAGVLLMTRDGGDTWSEAMWASGHGTDWSAS